MHQFSTFLLLYEIFISFHLLMAKISKKPRLNRLSGDSSVSISRELNSSFVLIYVNHFLCDSQPNLFQYNIHFSCFSTISAIITNYFWYPVITLTRVQEFNNVLSDETDYTYPIYKRTIKE